MKRRQFSARLAAVGLGLPWVDVAHAQNALTEGNEYLKVAQPVPVTAPAGKIEVVEFFSYACPHCRELEPVLENWVKRLAPEISFHRIPVPFLFNAERFQAMYYAFEELNVVDAMQLKVFNAVHVEKQRFETPKEISALVTQNGLDATKFMSIFNSFSVRTKVQRAGQLANAYGVDGVPMLGVQGRFVTSPVLARGNEKALRVVDQLVQKVRGSR